MGGIGSGNRWSKQTTVEEARRIDIRYMKKQGMLVAGRGGSFNWKCGGDPGGNVSFQCHHDYLQLDYCYRVYGGDWQPIEQCIYFDRTPCNYGGERLWFLCPRCSRRVGLLCCDGPLFLCRQCYQLPYASQHESCIDRLIRQKHKLGKRLFEHYEDGEGWGKKKGMHWKTYHRLHARYEVMERQWCQLMGQYLHLL